MDSANQGQSFRPKMGMVKNVSNDLIFVVFGIYNKESGLEGSFFVLNAFTSVEKAEEYCKSYNPNRMRINQFKEIQWQSTTLS